jgi:hypothetical protein
MTYTADFLIGGWGGSSRGWLQFGLGCLEKAVFLRFLALGELGELLVGLG